MTIGKERRIISIIFVGGHLLACALVGIFFLMDWIDSTDATLFVSIAVPALTPYTTIVLKYYLSHSGQPMRAADSLVEENPTLMILLPLCLLTVLISVIIARVFFHRMASVESFAVALLLGETLFGVYAGMIVHALFGNGA
jgi:hypothetical protein